jgi:hypothetical protein
LHFYRAAADSPVPHLDWAMNIEAGIQVSDVGNSSSNKDLKE